MVLYASLFSDDHYNSDASQHLNHYLHSTNLYPIATDEYADHSSQQELLHKMNIPEPELYNYKYTE